MSTTIKVSKIIRFARVAATSVSYVIKVIMNKRIRHITKRNLMCRNVIDNTFTNENYVSSTISHDFNSTNETRYNHIQNFSAEQNPN